MTDTLRKMGLEIVHAAKPKNVGKIRNSPKKLGQMRDEVQRYFNYFSISNVQKLCTTDYIC
jgi:hypothetical protein